jgi:hypothetical protein
VNVRGHVRLRQSDVSWTAVGPVMYRTVSLASRERGLCVLSEGVARHSLTERRSRARMLWMPGSLAPLVHTSLSYAHNACDLSARPPSHPCSQSRSRPHSPHACGRFTHHTERPSPHSLTHSLTHSLNALPSPTAARTASMSAPACRPRAGTCSAPTSGWTQAWTPRPVGSASARGL